MNREIRQKYILCLFWIKALKIKPRFGSKYKAWKKLAAMANIGTAFYP